MAIKYPNDLDDNSTLNPIVDNVSEVSGETINQLISAVIAIQTAIGVSPQGTQSNLTARLAETLNDDGTIKAAALTAAGLIALPITNAQIGASAAIEESKLNLDYSTQSLETRIDGNDVDIAALQDQAADIINRISRHVNGLAEKHESIQINHSLLDGYAGGPGTTVESALNYIWGTFLAHRSAASDIQHEASTISYTPLVALPGEQPIITSTNVQGAISEIESGFGEDRRDHNDSAHSNGVSKDGYVYLNGQGNVEGLSARLTRFQGNATSDGIKIGLINSASVKTKGLELSAITSTSQSVDITAKSGTSSRTMTVTAINLGAVNEGVYPAAATTLSLRGLVDSFNKQFAANNFPVAAFESDDGELVLQHNIARDDCSITIEEPASLSATAALGFTDIIDTEVSRINSYRMFIDGNPFNELRTISSGDLNQASNSTTVDLGVDVTSSGLNLRQGQLIHIFDHVTAAENGTYRVSSVSAGTTITVDSALDSGDFSYIIYDDILDPNVSGNSVAVDLYLDSERNTVTSLRAEVTSPLMLGLLSIVEVSESFPEFTGATLALTKSGTTYSLVLSLGSDSGKVTTFEQGYLGEVKVYAPDNISYITMQVVNGNPAAPRTDTINFSTNERQDDRFFLGTAHIRSGGSQIEYPLDRRNVGLSGKKAIGSSYQDIVNSDIDNFHLSGVVRGFDIVSNTVDNLVLNGGVAYIGGKKIVKERRTINVTNVATAFGTYNVILFRDGTISIFNDSSTGYSFAEALRTGAFIPLAQVVVDATPEITSVSDARFMINDIESRLELTVDDREFGAGSFRTLEAAVLYSNEVPNDIKPEIKILSDYTVTGSLTIGSGTRIVAFNDLSITNQLTMSDNTELVVFGTFTVGDTASIGANSTLDLRSTASIGNNTTMFEGSSLIVKEDIEVTSISIAESNISVIGNRDAGLLIGWPEIKFDGSSTGFIHSNGADGLTLKNILFTMTNATSDIILFAGTSEGHSIINCGFQQESALSAGDLSSTRSGIDLFFASVSNSNIEGCYFNNLGVGISCSFASVFDRIKVENCRFNSIGIGISITSSASRMVISKNTFSAIHESAISSATTNRVLITENIIYEMFEPSSSPIPIRISGSSNNVVISSNSIEDYDTTKLVELSSGNNLMFTQNVIRDNTTSDYAIDFGSVTSNGMISDNTLDNHTGRILSAQNSSVVNNNFAGAGEAGQTNIDLQSNTKTMSFSGNHIKLTETSTSALIRNYMCASNFIEIGTIEFEETSLPFNVTGNHFNMLDATATNSIVLSNSGTDASLFSNNVVTGVATTSALFLNNGIFSVTGNVLDGSSCARAITVGDNNTSSSVNFSVNDNKVVCGTAHGIYVDSSNVIVSGNNTSGSITGADVLVTSGKENVSVTNNILNTTGAGGATVSHNDASPTNCYFDLNKNAEVTRVYSAFEGVTNGTWTVSIAPPLIELTSTTTDDEIIVPLSGLPVGVELVSVSLFLNNPGSQGDVEIYLYERGAGSSTNVTEIGSGVSSAAASYQTMQVAPNSTTYVENNKEYLFRIKSVASGNKIGQVVVTIKY